MYNQAMQNQKVTNKPTAAAVLSMLAGICGLVISLLSLVSFVLLYSVLNDLGYYNGYYAADFANFEYFRNYKIRK